MKFRDMARILKNKMFQKMKVYLENNKQGKYGRHKYSLEEYGFKAENVYQEYRDYMEHYGFGIPEKSERPVSFDFGLGAR